MIKIVHIVSTLRKTGPMNVLYNILKNLDKEKYDVTIITLSPEVKEYSLWQQFLEIGCKIESLNLSRIQGYLYGGLKLRKLVRNINPSIVHAHCFRTILFTALFLSQYSTVATIHCDYDVDFQMNYGKFISYFMSKIMDYSLTKLRKRVCVSALLCKMLSKKKKFELTFINNGIDTEKFKPIINKNELRQKLNLPLNKTIFIWVGCLTDRKNPLLLASALNKFSENDYIVFCGNGNLYQDLYDKTCSFKNILLTGNVDNIEEYLQVSDYYVSTSLSEGLPMSVLEGMACGLPCLLSNIPQHEFLFNYELEIGICYDVNKINNLTNACENIKQKSYQQLSNNAKEVAITHFNGKLMSKQYEELYDNII